MPTGDCRGIRDSDDQRLGSQDQAVRSSLIHFLKLNETQLLKEKKLSITHTSYHAEMRAKKKKRRRTRTRKRREVETEEGTGLSRLRWPDAWLLRLAAQELGSR